MVKLWWGDQMFGYWIVVSYRDNFCPVIETFSLKTCEHLWMKSNSEIDMTETMRQRPEDVVTFNDCIAVFKFQNVRLHIFDDTSLKVNMYNHHHNQQWNFSKFIY